MSAAQVPIISQRYPKVKAIPAPAPSDIIWANMSASPEHTENVAYLSSIFYYSGMCLYLHSFYVHFFVNVTTLRRYCANFSYFLCFFSFSCFVLGLLFWGAILSSVAVLSDLSTLQQYAPFLSFLNDTAKSILQGLLPVFVMLLFALLIRFIMEYVATNIEKRKTISAVQQEIFKWYFMVS